MDCKKAIDMLSYAVFDDDGLDIEETIQIWFGKGWVDDYIFGDKETLFSENNCIRCGQSIPSKYNRCFRCADVEKKLPDYLKNLRCRAFTKNLIKNEESK